MREKKGRSPRKHVHEKKGFLHSPQPQNLRKLEHHYRITSGRFHTYTYIYLPNPPPPLPRFFFYKPPTNITDGTFIPAPLGWLFGQPRRLEWDPLMICAPPALRYSLLAAMQVGGVVGGIVSLGGDFLGKSEEWLGRMGGKWK